MVIFKVLACHLLSQLVSSLPQHLSLASCVESRVSLDWVTVSHQDLYLYFFPLVVRLNTYSCTYLPACPLTSIHSFTHPPISLFNPCPLTHSPSHTPTHSLVNLFNYPLQLPNQSCPHPFLPLLESSSEDLNPGEYIGRLQGALGMRPPCLLANLP